MVSTRVASAFAARMAAAQGVDVEDYVGAMLPGRAFFARGQVILNGQPADDPDSFCIAFEWSFPNNILKNPLASRIGAGADALLDVGAILPFLEVVMYFDPAALIPSESPTLADGLRVVTSTDVYALPAGMPHPDDPHRVIPGITAFRGMVKFPVQVFRSTILGPEGFPTALTRGFKKVEATLYLRKDLIRETEGQEQAHEMPIRSSTNL